MNSASSKEDKQYLHQLKYILYGIMGAFYFSSRYQPWVKYLWVFVNVIVILITQFLGTIGYFMTSTPKPIRDIFYALLSLNVVVLAVFATPCLTYYFKSKIEQMLTLSEEEFFAKARTEGTEMRETKNDINKMIILHIVSVGAYVLIHPLFQFFMGDTDSLNNLDYNIFAHMWLGSVQTSLQYYAIFIMHFAAAALVLISFITFSIYVYFAGQEFCVGFAGLRHFLDDISALAKRNIEKPSNKGIFGETTKETKMEDDISEDCKMANEVNQELVSSLIIAIRAHQVLYRKMKIIKPHIELLFSSVLIILVGDQCFFVFMMCSIDLGIFLKSKEVLGIFYINIILFTYCRAGKLLDDAANTISTELIDMPWYNMTSQQKKTYHIFLCQTQRIMHFNACGVYAMNMPIVLQNLRITFSLYNILRQVLN